MQHSVALTLSGTNVALTLEKRVFIFNWYTGIFSITINYDTKKGIH